jgi:WD40 repeat protein
VVTTAASHLSDVRGRVKVWDEESGVLHREIEGFEHCSVTALATFLSPDGQQPRLVVGSQSGEVRVYDPEAGSVLHRLDGSGDDHAHAGLITGLACIASSSAAPHHPRLVSTSWDRAAKVWDGETGGWLADLGGEGSEMMAVAAWKEHTGGHDRIAALGYDGHVRVWDGEAFTLLHDLDCASTTVVAFESAGGAVRLLVAPEGRKELQVWDPEEGRRLHECTDRGCPLEDCHLFESAQGRHLLAVVGRATRHRRHPGDTLRPFLDVWDLGQAPVAEVRMRSAKKEG